VAFVSIPAVGLPVEIFSRNATVTLIIAVRMLLLLRSKNVRTVHGSGMTCACMAWACAAWVCAAWVCTVGAHCAGVLIMHVPGVSMQKHGCSSDVKKKQQIFHVHFLQYVTESLKHFKND
jgi:hypothetical protein